MQEKIEDEKDNENNLKKENRQIMWMMTLMTLIIIIVIMVPYVYNNFINKFDYNGLEFQKTKLGDLVFYSSKFPVVSGTGQVIGDYAVNLRNDPRELDDVIVNVTDNKIQFALEGNKFGTTYISLNPFMKMCEDTVISMAALSGFLGDSGLEVKSAYTDKAYARENNGTHRWCYDSGFDTVIIVTDGNETSITEIAPNCYKISYKDCEILKASERFELLILEEYADRFKKTK